MRTASVQSGLLKGTVPPDFSPLVFFFKQLLLAPVDKPSNALDFFRIFAEIFEWHRRCKRFYYSWMILSNFEWTLLRSNIYWWLVFLLVFPLNALANCKGPTGASTMSKTPAKLAIFTVRYQWHWWHASPVSLTPANTCFAGVIDTGECMLCRCPWHRWGIFCRCRWHRWSSLKQ